MSDDKLTPKEQAKERTMSDDKLTPKEQARLLMEANRHPVPLQMTQLFGISWEAAPEGFDCPRCKGALERTRGLMIASPWAGSVRCTKCDYRDSVIGSLGRSMVQVEPLPPGATPLYLSEPEGEDP